MTATEYIILVDEQDQEIGLGEKLSVHKKNQLHRAFSVFIFRQTSQIELLLQQRALGKYHSPGLWTNTCCSHPHAGEGIVQAGERRLQQELGIITSLTDLGWFHYNAHFPNGLSENEIDHVLVASVPADVKIMPNPDEIHALRWISVETCEKELADHPEQFTPWFKQALNLAKKAYL